MFQEQVRRFALSPEKVAASLKGASILSPKSIFYCRFKYVYVYIF